MAEVTDRQKLSIQCTATIQFHFGSICDEVDAFVLNGILTKEQGEAFKRRIRRHGNNAIVVIDNHLEYWHVSRNHRLDTLNPSKIARKPGQVKG